MNKQEQEAKLSEARASLSKLQAEFAGSPIPAGVAKIINAIQAHINYAEAQLNGGVGGLSTAA